MTRSTLLSSSPRPSLLAADTRSVTSCRRLTVTSLVVLLLLAVFVVAAVWPLDGGLKALH